MGVLRRLIESVAHLHEVSGSVVDVGCGIAALVGGSQYVAVGVMGPLCRLSQRIGLAGPIAAAVICVAGRAAVGVGHAGHLVEDWLVSELGDISVGIRNLRQVALGIVL